MVRLRSALAPGGPELSPAGEQKIGHGDVHTDAPADNTAKAADDAAVHARQAAHTNSNNGLSAAPVPASQARPGDSDT
jgi:hypothetical protein